MLQVGAPPAEDQRYGRPVHRPPVEIHALAQAFHEELLEVVAEQGQPRFVADEAERVQVEFPPEVVDEQTREGRQPLGVGMTAEVFVGRLGAFQQGLESFRPDCGRSTDADRRPQRKTTAGPGGKRQDVRVVEPELPGPLDLGRGRPAALGPVGAEPVPRRTRLQQGLFGGEGLRGDHQAGGPGIEPAAQALEAPAVEGRQPVHPHGAVVGVQGVGHESGAQVGAADADVQQVGQAGLAGVEGARHGQEARALGHDLLGLVDGQATEGPGRPQGHVQRGLVLAGIDDCAREQAFDCRRQAAGLGQPLQCSQAAPVERNAGKVETPAAAFAQEIVGPVGIGRHHFGDDRNVVFTQHSAGRSQAAWTGIRPAVRAMRLSASG